MSSLALLFALRIMEGKNTFAEVPKALKVQVKEILIEHDCGHLAE